MKVHITCTPEFKLEELTRIVSLLKSTPGELDFEKREVWSSVKFSSIDKRFSDIENIPRLSFEESFHLVQAYRNFTEGIKEEDFVILISTLKHDDDWFSAFDKQNIFIYGAEWEKISKAEPLYGIAYQCVENIFQSLLGLDIIDYNNEPNIHKKIIGCINDFCDDEKEIIHKLRTADICESCLERADKEGVDAIIIEQIGFIIEEIRQEFISKRKLTPHVQIKIVDVDASANIKIGDEIFNPVGEIAKLLFIYFLKHPEGVESQNICSQKDEFLRIYELIKRKDQNQTLDRYTTNMYKITIENLCCRQGVDPNRNFRTNKSKLNKELERFLGAELAKEYMINSINLGNKNYLFKTNLNHDYCNIDPRF